MSKIDNLMNTPPDKFYEYSLVMGYKDQLFFRMYPNFEVLGRVAFDYNCRILGLKMRVHTGQILERLVRLYMMRKNLDKKRGKL